MIEIKNVSKTYNNNIKAIDNLNLKINDGEIVGFIGLNGAGKTTAIKMMTGILQPDIGTIKINGYDIVKDSLKAKQIIGYIADSPDMFLKLTGMEFINFIANIYKVPLDVRKKRIKEFGERFGLSDVLDKPMQSYSHGMRQKIMVVAALVHDPDVWILDEPLIGLDPTSAFELKKMMREHADKGNSVFFSTHVLEVAEKLCDKIAIIDKGKVVFIGTLKELKDKYDKKDLEELFMEVIKHE
ncbi:MAG: ABC transporter ATP-binding protein [Tenericutes bacterium]|nr:ABC transporter ATP-binding protein [Mycoplasmatota bacterium]